MVLEILILVKKKLQQQYVSLVKEIVIEVE
jgi:hypothetical protein